MNEHPSQPDGAASSLADRVRSLRLPDEVTADRARGAWLPWALCALLALSTVYLTYLAYSLRKVETPSQPAGPGAATVAPVGDVVLESKGYIVPVHQIQVSPKVGGMVVKLDFEEGKHVLKGQVLAQLETTDYKAERDRAKAVLKAAWQRYLELYNGSRPEEIKQAKAELDEAEAQRSQLYLDWRRSTTLNRQALAPREFEQAESAYKAMDRRVEKLKQAHALMVEGPRAERIDAAYAEMMQAEADLAKAEWRLDNCTIRAPVTGTILTKKAEEGNIVNPIAFNVSASLCDMADLSDLEVDVTIQERDIANVVKRQRCKIRPEAFPKREYEGFVSRVMPTADRAKGAIPVRVKVNVPREEEGQFLKPEMSVLVSFYKNKDENKK